MLKNSSNIPANSSFFVSIEKYLFQSPNANGKQYIQGTRHLGGKCLVPLLFFLGGGRIFEKKYFMNNV